MLGFTDAATTSPASGSSAFASFASTNTSGFGGLAAAYNGFGGFGGFSSATGNGTLFGGLGQSRFLVHFLDDATLSCDVTSWHLLSLWSHPKVCLVSSKMDLSGRTTFFAVVHDTENKALREAWCRASHVMRRSSAAGSSGAATSTTEAAAPATGAFSFDTGALLTHLFEIQMYSSMLTL